MKSSMYKIAAAALLVSGLSACSEEQLLVEGEGRVKLSATLNSDVTVVSRAQSDEELAESCTVWISNSKGVVREYHGLNSVPTDGIALYSGHYTAQGWAGTKAWASWDERWFEGTSEFDVRKGETTAVDLKCKIQNTLVSVVYEDGAKEVLHDYTMTVGHVYGELTFEGDDERKAYFLISDDDRTITYTLSGTTSAGEQFTRTKTIENAKPTTEYVLTVRHTGEDSELGGGYLTIDVDEHEVVVEDQIVITVAPQIEGYHFDINQGIRGEAGELGRKSVFVKAACALRSVVLSSAALEEYTTIGGDDVDLMQMTDAVSQLLNDSGITREYVYDAENDLSYMKINFEELFTDKFEDGEYSFVFNATDVLGKSATATLKVVVSADPVTTIDAAEGDAYATHATLRAAKGKDADSYGFNYRTLTSRSDEWSYIEGHLEGNEIVAELTDLTPGTTYEYTAVAGDFVSPNVQTFTTEETAQLPNAGFEDWDLSGKDYKPFTTNPYWSCGNKGSSTMNKNVTYPVEDIKHSGKYAVKLESQFVGVFGIGKFAAGNIFIGEYLKTDGTDGILGWGRPFTSRPTAVKVWAKYTPGAVTHDNSDTPANVHLAKGEMDKGIIYVALLDNSKCSDADYGEQWPVVVRTKASQRNLFDKNGSNVIAYGEYVFETATDGDGLVEITIPIEYFRNDVKPVSILLTASASRNGDYFEGGPSTMILDDFELVY